MPAAVTLASDLVAACSVAPTWVDSGSQIATAIDKYMNAVSIKTIVTGAGVTPPPASAPYTGTGTGSGVLVMTGTAILSSSCIAAYGSPAWSAIGSLIATAILTYILTGVVTTTVTPSSPGDTLVGTGAGSFLIVPVTFIADITNLFNPDSKLTWVQIGNQMASLIVALFATITLITVDSGTVPPASWGGKGVGQLTWS